MAPSMPRLNEKSAPRFESSTDPEELERFFLRLEELFNKCAVTMDAEKKKYAVVYTNIKMEKQWKVLEHHAKGTFKEFKKDILRNETTCMSIQALSDPREVRLYVFQTGIPSPSGGSQE
ncbi:hypothetical protein ARMGADRAFT_1022883 [Armillaria gallica]|uniref:Uncharacterized protein n=1 Tax=Armillaria gallica TaxID=47427 RepID=A0A2H3EE29_ARMGA|nr:hypothetical protein ARMGADRAFT_1022883 [Armillaria gallica]